MNTFILYRNEKVWYWPGLRRAPFLHYRELFPSHKPDLDLHGLLGHKTFVENICDTVMMFKTNLSRSCWVFAGGAPAISLIVASWRNNLGGNWLLIFLYSYSYIVASWRKSLGENWLLILFDWQSGAESSSCAKWGPRRFPGNGAFKIDQQPSQWHARQACSWHTWIVKVHHRHAQERNPIFIRRDPSQSEMHGFLRNAEKCANLSCCSVIWRKSKLVPGWQRARPALVVLWDKLDLAIIRGRIIQLLQGNK